MKKKGTRVTEAEVNRLQDAYRKFPMICPRCQRIWPAHAQVCPERYRQREVAKRLGQLMAQQEDGA